MADKVADAAVRELLFLAAIEGMSCLSRGGKGCVFRAVEVLRPDIARQWDGGDDPGDLLHRFFPDPERSERESAPSIFSATTAGVSAVLPPAALEILLRRAEHLLISLHNQVQQMAEAQRSVEVFARGSSADLATLRELCPLLAGQRGAGAMLDKLAELEERMAAEGLG